jgi:hypothetical protein
LKKRIVESGSLKKTNSGKRIPINGAFTDGTSEKQKPGKRELQKTDPWKNPTPQKELQKYR